MVGIFTSDNGNSEPASQMQFTQSDGIWLHTCYPLLYLTKVPNTHKMKYKNSKAPYSSKHRLCESQNKKTVNPHRLFAWAKSKENWLKLSCIKQYSLQICIYPKGLIRKIANRFFSRPLVWLESCVFQVTVLWRHNNLFK